MSPRAQILGVGHFVPENVVTNGDLVSMMDTSDEWIRTRTGIEERHWVDLGSTTATSDLALRAAERALAASDTKAKDLDMIILATITPDHEFPGTSCFLQSKLGAQGCAVIDIRQACSGFIYALSIADQFVSSGHRKKVLVVGAEVHSKGLDRTPRGRDVSVLFGDGAGAVVLGAATDGARGVIKTVLHADGDHAKELWAPAPGMAYPTERMSALQIENGDRYAKMNGKAVFVHAVRRMSEVVLETLDGTGYGVPDVDLFLFHQANLRINDMVGEQLKIKSDRVFNTIQKFGNTTAATIPIGMAEAVAAGKLKPGMLVMTAAFGSGFTWAGGLVRW